MTQEIVSTTTFEYEEPDEQSKIALALASWLLAKAGHSGSLKTKTAYQTTITAFRAVLQKVGYDLDAPTEVIALTAQGWAAQRYLSSNNLQASNSKSDSDGNGSVLTQTIVLAVTSKTTPEHSALTKSNATAASTGGSSKNEVSPATYNQRLAILSSFYTYARRQGLLIGENPIDRVERRAVQFYADAHAQEYAEIKAQLKEIDRSTLDGQRDYALLSVALQTGRRISELAALSKADMRLQPSSGKITLSFKRTKGGKTIRDTLPAPTSRALVEWLVSYYEVSQITQLSNDAPLWVSLSRRNRGQALTIQTLADICERRLGTSKFHSLRHTFARAMEDSGAKVSEIQARLGHNSLDVTGRYLAALRRDENSQADKLAQLFGLE